MNAYQTTLKTIMVVLIAIAAVCTIIGMVLGPLGEESWSVRFSVAACIAAFCGIILMAAFWKKSNS